MSLLLKIISGLIGGILAPLYAYKNSAAVSAVGLPNQ